MLRKLEKYELIREIGHGGMATVYEARDSRLDRSVAVKVLHPHLRGAEEARARFTREARSVARLKHPNILEIYDNSEEESEESYIVTELLTGPTLKRFGEEHDPIPAEVAACFAIQIAGALACAHEAGIVHRDVKPENVLLHEDRTVKLTDFGIAQMVDSQSFTATGQILGSPGHMAPEQVEGGECDERTDVFALGTVFYFLVTGRLPFQGKNPHQILRRVMDSDYPDPLRVRPSVGGRVSEILRRALAREPADRYRDAKELEEALRRFVGETGIDEPAATLARYLVDPDGVSAELREETIARLIELGEAAMRTHDVATALEHFNRVLGLDEGNERVLALIEKVGTRSRQRATLAASGVALAVFGVAALGYAVFSPNHHPVAEGVGVPPHPTGAPPVPGVDADAGPPPEAGVPVRLSQPAGGRPVSPTAMVHAHVPPLHSISRTPRNVRFNPTPRSVQVSVDDGPLQPFFREVTLAPGRHRFTFSGSCCEDLTFSENISPGPGVTTVARTLHFKASRLYVACAQNGDVLVGRGKGIARGRIRQLFQVPMTGPSLRVPVTVTAGGFREYRGTVNLRPGERTDLNVVLEEVSGSQP